MWVWERVSKPMMDCVDDVSSWSLTYLESDTMSPVKSLPRDHIDVVGVVMLKK